MFDLPIITDPWFYVLAVPAVLMVGIAKTGVGGSNVLGVSMMSFVITVPQATAILLPILCLCDLFGVWVYRGKWDWRNLAILLPGATIGIAIGWMGFSFLDGWAVKFLVGGIAVWFSIAQFLPLIHKREVAAAGRNVPKGLFWSALGGFTSFVAHAGQPPVSIYLIPQRLPKEIYLGTNAIFWAYTNYLKLLPFFLLGQLNVSNMSTALALTPCVPVGLALGVWIQRKLSPTAFYKTVLGLLFVTGIKLVWDGLMSAF